MTASRMNNDHLVTFPYLWRPDRQVTAFSRTLSKIVMKEWKRASFSIGQFSLGGCKHPVIKVSVDVTVT